MSISRHSVFISISQSVVFVTGIAAGVVITRVLGPTNRGIYFMVLTINALFVNTANLGIRFTNTYLLSKKKYTLTEVNSNSILIAFIIGFLCLLAYLLFSDYIDTKFFKEIKPAYTLLSISLIPFVLYSQYWLGIMAGLNRFFLISAIDISTSLIGAFLSIILVLNWGLSGILWLWFVTGICLFLLKIYFINRVEKIRLKLSWRIFKESLSFGFVGHLGNLAYNIYNRLDIFIINFFNGLAGVGIYSLAFTIAENASFFPNAIVTAANPRLCSAATGDAQKLAAKVARHTIMLAVATSVLILMITPWAIPLVYGKEFLPSVKPLMILLCAAIFMAGSSTISSFFTFHLGKPHLSTITGWIALCINIPLCIIFIPKFGFVGAALAVSVTYASEFTLLLILFKRRTNISWNELFIINRDDIASYFKLYSYFRIKLKLRQTNAIIEPLIKAAID